MISLTDISWSERQKSRTITIAVHLLILLLALWPFLRSSSWQQESGVQVEFAELKMQQPVIASDSPEKTARGNKESLKKGRMPEKQTASVTSSAPIIEETMTQKESEVSSAAEPLEATDQESLRSPEPKRQFGHLFGNSSNGDSEEPSGSSDRNGLGGLASSHAVVGEGLQDRKIIFKPVVQDDSQRRGRVAVRICVNTSGRVITADFTQRGSTTTDSYLVDKAVTAARKWRFSQSEIERQCGTVSIDFDLK